MKNKSGGIIPDAEILSKIKDKKKPSMKVTGDKGVKRLDKVARATGGSVGENYGIQDKKYMASQKISKPAQD